MPAYALVFVLAAVAGAPADPGTGTGQLGTLERGLYRCEAPGDASGLAGIPREEEDFEVISSSRYKAFDGRGTYLRKGDLVTMTSGPRRGIQYRLESEQHLERLDSAEGVRCYWKGRLYD